MRFRSDVQGLRAVAVLPVLLYHFGLEAVPGGFTGVDIFFTISGFVIAGSILEDMRADRFSIAGFYFKRTRRIFPALGATMALTTIAAIAILLPDDLVSYGWSLLATGTFWSNVHFWKTSGYFAAAAQTKPLLHTWSLSIEEQFYVVAPIAFALIYRHGRQRWLAFLTPVALASLACGIVAVFVGPTAGFFVLPTRAWELLIGAIVALHARAGPIRPRGREMMAAIGLVLIGIGLFTLHETDPFPGWNALFPCVGTALILQSAIGAERLPLVGRLLSAAPLLWIGNISYSLYLVHWPIAALTRYATLRAPGPGTALLMFAASIGLATLSWRFVEEPFRHVERRHMRRVLLAGLGMIVLVAAVAMGIVAAKGFPQRVPNYARQTVPGNEEWGGERCFNTDATRPIGWDAQACTRIRGAHGRILLWGDSFAAQYVPGILRDARRIDADVLQYTFAGCPPILSYTSLARLGCGTSNARVPALIRAQHVDTVVISARWSDTPLRRLRELHETIAAIRALGTRVIVFGQSPQFIADVQQVDYISGNRADAAGARWPIAFDRALNARVAREAAAGGAVFVDPIALLCEGDDCPYRMGNTYLYSDFGHFSTAGSVIAVRRYFPAGSASQ